MEIGWHRVCTHFGVTITGSTSVRYRSISKLADPEPITTAARSSTVSTGPAARTVPTSCRLRRWSLSSASSSPSPPR